MGWGYYGYPVYVPVAKRKAKALREVQKLTKKGQKINPIHIEGRSIAQSVWGKAWCENLEFYSDYENRLPRGRSYVRNGLVVDLNIKAGEVNALVYGTSLYNIHIKIAKAIEEKWKAIKEKCAGKIDSLLELLQGKFSKSVMEIITHPESGLFPNPKEIELSCSCPDYAVMCKHVAAVLYAVGARLDTEPEALFTLRQVDHMDLITVAGAADSLVASAAKDDFAADDLSRLFGIDIDQSKSLKVPKRSKSNKTRKAKVAKKATQKRIKKIVKTNPKNKKNKKKIVKSEIAKITNAKKIAKGKKVTPKVGIVSIANTAAKRKAKSKVKAKTKNKKAR